MDMLGLYELFVYLDTLRHKTGFYSQCIWIRGDTWLDFILTVFRYVETHGWTHCQCIQILWNTRLDSILSVFRYVETHGCTDCPYLDTLRHPDPSIDACPDSLQTGVSHASLCIITIHTRTRTCSDIYCHLTIKGTYLPLCKVSLISAVRGVTTLLYHWMLNRIIFVHSMLKVCLAFKGNVREPIEEWI